MSATVDIIAANPWAVLVSCTDEALLASHIPVILDREGERCSDISRELIHIRGC
jgi:predicted FMN-binding regulatory protein PaiB